MKTTLQVAVPPSTFPPDSEIKRFINDHPLCKGKTYVSFFKDIFFYIQTEKVRSLTEIEEESHKNLEGLVLSFSSFGGVKIWKIGEKVLTSEKEAKEYLVSKMLEQAKISLELLKMINLAELQNYSKDPLLAAAKVYFDFCHFFGSKIGEVDQRGDGSSLDSYFNYLPISPNLSQEALESFKELSQAPSEVLKCFDGRLISNSITPSKDSDPSVSPRLSGTPSYWKIPPESLASFFLRTSVLFGKTPQSQKVQKVAPQLQKALRGTVQKLKRTWRGFDKITPSMLKEMETRPTAQSMIRHVEERGQNHPIYFQKVHQAPLVIFLLDISGSMGQNFKIEQGLGVLFHWTMLAAEGKASLVFATYLSEMNPPHFLSQGTPLSEALEWFNQVSNFELNPMGTDIQRALVEMSQHVLKEELVKPGAEVIIQIANDGQDEVDPEKILKVLPKNTSVNALVLEGSNCCLQQVCKLTGGLYQEGFTL